LQPPTEHGSAAAAQSSRVGLIPACPGPAPHGPRAY